MIKEFTLVKGHRYKAKIHLPGFEDYTSNDKIADMLVEAGFSDIDVSGSGSTREGAATWAGETINWPVDRHIVEISEVIEPAPVVEPVVVPDSPPVFEKLENLKPEKKLSSSSQEDDE